ncbi:MAG: SMP-30/gluconolactonase/LRE family protein [Acidobacteria bacterium]|nr:SMP-30/gluconolactonase/LRE family protein [Acidobacteriota bacterium]
MSSKPHIESIFPRAAIAGGDVQISGSGFCTDGLQRPRVRFGGIEANLLISSNHHLIARVPDGAVSSDITVDNGEFRSNPCPIEIGVAIAENMHPVANPALDKAGNIFVTFSGSRGQKVPASVYKIDSNYNVKPFLSDVMNPTGLAFDRNNYLYISSRYDGNIYRAAPNGTVTVYAEGMGVATGIAFDHDEFLYVGDRSVTVFKSSPDRQIYVFATLEPSISAYHLAFGPGGDLYVAGPTTSSYDSIYRISRAGEVEKFYRGLGRPQGLAFDREGNLYVAASRSGRKGVFRITPQGEAELLVSGIGLVGLAFARGPAAILVNTQTVYHLNWGVRGKPLVE